MKESVSICKIQRDGKVILDTDRMADILKNIGSHPFAIVSINGQFRQGKSFMLNIFLQYLTRQEGDVNWFKPLEIGQAFKWRRGDSPETNGIDIFPEPITVTFPSGKMLKVLLLDTQGSFDNQTSMHENATIFAISALLSSTTVLNVMGGVNAGMLQFLQFFVGFAQVALETTCDDDNRVNFEQLFQTLFFLIRDFQWVDEFPLGYYDDNISPGPMNYKKVHLSQSDNKSYENNFIIQHISSVFTKVGVNLLPRPGDKFASGASLADLDPKWCQEAKKFVELCFSEQNLASKTVGGVGVTGVSFMEYVKRWGQLFSTKDGMPELKSIFETTVEVQNIIATREALACYKMEMKSYLQKNLNGVQSPDFKKMHEDACKKSFAIFKQCRRMGGKKYDDKYSKELLTEIEPMRIEFEELNTVKWDHFLERQKFEKEQAHLKGKISAIESNFTKEIDAMKKREQQVLKEMEECQGSNEHLIREHEKLKEDLVKAQEKLEEERNRPNSELNTLIQQVSSLTQQMQESNAAHAQQINNLQAQLQAAQRQPRRRKRARCVIS